MCCSTPTIFLICVATVHHDIITVIVSILPFYSKFNLIKSSIMIDQAVMERFEALCIW